MEATSTKQRSFSVGRKNDKTRRSWTIKEEQALISALKDIVARGWKCDNGFKTGYLGILEQAMIQAFPGTDLKADPHINSKIHVWKKNYGSLSTMLSRSGFGWNDSSHTIDVENDQVWETYVKTDSNARTMRYKAWPFYKDWSEIFGKDRATGENAEAFADVVQELLNKDKEKEHASTDGDYVPYNMENEDLDADLMSICREMSSTSTKTKSSTKKRKNTDDIDDRFIDLMHAFCDKTDARLGELTKRIGFEYDASMSRKNIFEALGHMDNLGVEDKIYVAKLLCNNTKDLDLFFSLPNDAKAIMVKMIIDGRL